MGAQKWDALRRAFAHHFHMGWYGMGRHSMNGIDIVWYGIDMGYCTPLPALTLAKRAHTP